MAYDGHILCRKCRLTLYLGKHKNGRFQQGVVDESQLAIGILQFITEHFPHGELAIMGDTPYERYLESCNANDWPTTIFVDVDSFGIVRLKPRD